MGAAWPGAFLAISAATVAPSSTTPMATPMTKLRAARLRGRGAEGDDEGRSRDEGSRTLAKDSGPGVGPGGLSDWGDTAGGDTSTGMVCDGRPV
jgi:hypothetical protein